MGRTEVGAVRHTRLLGISARRIEPVATRTVGRREAFAPKPRQLLDVLCWGEHQVVKVPADDVRRGLTRSCGIVDCCSRPKA